MFKKMDIISLKEAKHIKLFNRKETKYKCDFYKFCIFVKYLYDNYYVVSDNGTTLFDYMSIYFDTKELTMYNEHKNNVKNRQKVRIREYSNGDKFLEIKHKIDHKTNKIRIPIKNTNIDNNFDWIKEHLQYDISELSHILNVKYLRITFISKDYHERITIDFNIEFFNVLNNITKKINDIIIEVKQDEYSNDKIKEILNQYNIEECHFSKYFNGLNYTLNSNS